MVRSQPLRNSTCKSGISALLVVVQILWTTTPLNAAIPVHANSQSRATLASGVQGVWRSPLSHVIASAQRLFADVKNALPQLPSTQRELSRLGRTQFEEPLIATGPTSPKEDQALLRAITAYRDQAIPDDFRVFDVFLSEHPRSAWATGVLTNLGLLYYHYGYFSRAISSWEQAWQAGSSVTEVQPKALVNRAIGELIRMHARLGHADEVEAILKEIEHRPVSGSATEAVTGAREGLWMMRHDPGVAYLCGPVALKNLLILKGASRSAVGLLTQARSGAKGFTLAQVGQLADQANFPHRLVFREAGQPIPIPAVVHWKVSHFATIVGEEHGRFHIQDPTFGTDLWITRSAIESEASGYFLVPAGLARAWRSASAKEAAQMRGMGYTANSEPGATTPQDDKTKPGDCGVGMCGYNFHEMLVSLNLMDTPVGYTPPKGPDAHVTLTYNQREAMQPGNLGYFNVSPNWTLNWLSYIKDEPTCTDCKDGVMRYVAGGGAVTYSSPDAGASFTPETRDKSKLSLISKDPIEYQRELPDGSVEVYARSNGATKGSRLIFLTAITDPAGNKVTLNYDDQLRLRSFTDATGRSTTFSYDLATGPLLVTKITDPFGRSASLNYDSQGRLEQITDVLNLSSRFHYDDSGKINSGKIDSLTTPYGTTTFTYGEFTDNTTHTARYLTATDPLQNTERLEYVQGVSTIPECDTADPSKTIPQGIVAPFNKFLNGRNTYYWDGHAYAVAANDYTKARIKHWTHARDTSQTGHIVEYVKYPLENRVWFNYPGQPLEGVDSLPCKLISNPFGTAASGTLDKPSRIGRVLDDGRTQQLTQIMYNSKGHVTDIIDPVGRQTQFVYDTNDIDLLEVRQKTSPSGYSTIAKFSSYTKHLPQTYIDAAGRVWSYTYNSAGQPEFVTDPDHHLTSYQYNNQGYLVQIVHPKYPGDNGPPNNLYLSVTSFTYDASGRVRTRTDSEGYVVTYDYDDADRLTRETFPDGTTREYNWDRLDLSSVKDRTLPVGTSGRYRYAYDAQRNLKTITDSSQRKDSFEYYENGKLKSITDTKGNITFWSIDEQSRVTAKHVPDVEKLGSISSKRFVNVYESTTSRLKSVTDPLNQVKEYTYASDDQVIGIAYRNVNCPANVNCSANVNFVPDPYFRRVARMTDGSGTTDFSYGAVGSLGALQFAGETQENKNIGYQYLYDSLGRLQSRVLLPGPERFTYDSIGRMDSHFTALGRFFIGHLGGTGQVTSLGAEDTGLAISWSYGTNTNDRRLEHIYGSRQYDYTTNSEGIISQIVESDSVNTIPGQRWTYNYDFGYSSSFRLSKATLSTGATYPYEYDAMDCRFVDSGGTRLGCNSLNQLSGISYDDNGNLTDDGLRTYTWDAENQLVSINYKAQPSRSIGFRYDGLGRRIAIVVNGVESRYLWCGEVICAALSPKGDVTRRYYNEGEYIPASDTRLYYSRDHLGSVRDVIAGPNSSTRIASYDYDPYGRPIRTSGRVSTDFRFAGMFYEQNSGLYLTRYRVYDPSTGRWLSRDPLGESAGLNLYAYVGGNPVSLYDPKGLSGVVDFSAGFGDVLLLGQGSRLRRILGIDDEVDECSSWYIGGEVAGEIATTAAGGLFGAQKLTAAATKLPMRFKGQIGEALSVIENRLSRGTLVNTEIRDIPGLATRADSEWIKRGMSYFVESKFGNSPLSSAQKVAQRVLGASYHVERWGYDFVGRVGAYLGGGVGASLGAAAIDSNCGCRR
jgi:RHS repeat-associated protein